MANPIFDQTGTPRQPTVHPIHNAQNRILDPITGKWIPLKQPTVPLDEMTLDFPVLVMLKAVYTELRVLNYMMAASYGYNEDLDVLRNDPDFTIS